MKLLKFCGKLIFFTNLVKKHAFFDFFAPPFVYSWWVGRGLYFLKLDTRLQCSHQADPQNNCNLYDESQSSSRLSKCYTHDALWTSYNSSYPTKWAKFLYNTIFGYEESESDRFFYRKFFFHYSNDRSFRLKNHMVRWSKKFQISKIFAFSDSSHRKTVVYQKSAHYELPGVRKVNFDDSCSN